MYDPELLEKLSEAVGVKLKVRDNEKLKQETYEHLVSQLLKKEQAARDSGARTSDEVDEAKSVERFYDGANRKD